MSLQSFICNNSELVHTEDPCVRELGRVRGTILFDTAFDIEILIANLQSCTDADSLAAIELINKGISNGTVYIIPQTTGSYNGGEAHIVDGYRDGEKRVLWYDCELQFTDPSFRANRKFWQGAELRQWYIGWRTESLLQISTTPANIHASNPITDDLNSTVTWNVTTSWRSKYKPDILPLTILANYFGDKFTMYEELTPNVPYRVAEWGHIIGDITKQTDLIDLINSLKSTASCKDKNTYEVDFTFRQRKWAKLNNVVFCSDYYQVLNLMVETERVFNGPSWVDYVNEVMYFKVKENYPIQLTEDKRPFRIRITGHSADFGPIKFYGGGIEENINKISYTPDGYIGVSFALFPDRDIKKIEQASLHCYYQMSNGYLLTKLAPVYKFAYIVQPTDNGLRVTPLPIDCIIKVRKNKITLNVINGYVHKGEVDDKYREYHSRIKNHNSQLNTKTVYNLLASHFEKGQNIKKNVWVLRQMGNHRSYKNKIYKTKRRWVFRPIIFSDLRLLGNRIRHIAIAKMRANFRYPRYINPRRSGGYIVIFKSSWREFKIRPITKNDIFVGRRRSELAKRKASRIVSTL